MSKSNKEQTIVRKNEVTPFFAAAGIHSQTGEARETLMQEVDNFTKLLISKAILIMRARGKVMLTSEHIRLATDQMHRSGYKTNFIFG